MLAIQHQCAFLILASAFACGSACAECAYPRSKVLTPLGATAVMLEMLHQRVGISLLRSAQRIRCYVMRYTQLDTVHARCAGCFRFMGNHGSLTAGESQTVLSFERPQHSLLHCVRIGRNIPHHASSAGKARSYATQPTLQALLSAGSAARAGEALLFHSVTSYAFALAGKHRSFSASVHVMAIVVQHVHVVLRLLHAWSAI